MDMKAENRDTEFARLSRAAQSAVRAGDLAGYAETLGEMSCLLKSEGRRHDELKVLLLKLYIDLSGIGKVPVLEPHTLESIASAVEALGFSRCQVDELYMESIRSDVTPRHEFRPKDCLYLLGLYLDGRIEEANEIVRSAAKI